MPLLTLELNFTGLGREAEVRVAAPGIIEVEVVREIAIEPEVEVEGDEIGIDRGAEVL